jgi:hypothetical protein
MKWFKRCLWIAAWATWAWLGFGLHRELPRSLSPAITKLPLERDDTLLGFVKDTSYVVVQRSLPLSASKRSKIYPGWSGFRLLDSCFRVFDGHTGKLVRETTPGNYYVLGVPQSLRWHGVLFVSGRLPGSIEASADGNDLERLYRYDVFADSWKKISDRAPTVMKIVSHPTKPWIVVSDGRFAHGPVRTSVIDWNAGAELLVRQHDHAQDRVDAVFVGATDRIAFYIQAISTKADSARRADCLEFWRIGSPCQMEKVIRAGTAGAETETTRQWLQIWWNAPTVSKSGRAILAEFPAALWDVETPTRCWTPDATFWAAPLADAEAFSVTEFWAADLWDGDRKSRWNTVAHRDLESARFKRRCWQADSEIFDLTNGDESLAVSPSGAVHRLPLPPNLPLLALCQTILALPLILLWSILRWRRRRRMTIASA